MRRRMIFYI